MLEICVLSFSSASGWIRFLQKNWELLRRLRMKSTAVLMQAHCSPLLYPASLLRHPPTVFHHFIPPTNITQKTYCLLALIRGMMLTEPVPVVSLQISINSERSSSYIFCLFICFIIKDSLGCFRLPYYFFVYILPSLNTLHTFIMISSRGNPLFNVLTRSMFPKQLR